MCGKGKVIHDLDGAVLSGVQLVHLLGAKLPKRRTSEMPIVNVVDGDLSVRVGKIKLLTKSFVLVNILSCFYPHVQLAPINGVGNGIAQVFQLLYPWQSVSTEYKSWQLFGFLQEGH